MANLPTVKPTDAGEDEAVAVPTWDELVTATRSRLLPLTQGPGGLARVAKALGVSKGGLCTFLLGGARPQHAAWIVGRADVVYPP